jgi:hypothetical protein
MKKIFAAALVAAFAAVGFAVAATECTVEAVDGAKVTVACEAGVKAGDKVNMKAGEATSACVVDSAEGGKVVMTCEGAAVKAGDKVSVEAAAEAAAAAPAAEGEKKEEKKVEGC